jgi:S1-C subfamily serine protease
MFADAWERAAEHTRLVVTCARQADGSLSANGATFVVLSSDGWVVTAAHVFDAPTRADFLPPPLVERWWGGDGVEASEVHVYDDVDLAICRLAPAPRVDRLPSFRPATSQRLGTSLLTLGYPSDACDVQFDRGASEFRFAGATRGLYGVEGMLSRIIDAGMSETGYPRAYLETASAALIGQSGGPTVDVTGAVWGIQLRAHHEVLGFNVPIDVGQTVVTEHQVRNTAIGVQTATLEALFERHGIGVEWVSR